MRWPLSTRLSPCGANESQLILTRQRSTLPQSYTTHSQKGVEGLVRPFLQAMRIRNQVDYMREKKSQTNPPLQNDAGEATLLGILG
jgi:hypothetical protein